MIQSSNAELREKFSPKQRHQVAGIELRILNKFGFGFRVPNFAFRRGESDLPLGIGFRPHSSVCIRQAVVLASLTG